MTLRRASGVVLVLAIGLIACRSTTPPTRFVGVSQDTGTSARLQAISAVDANVVWVSGLQGRVMRSHDGGDHWISLEIPESAELQFRDVHAFDARHAFVLSAGDGALSRIYRTDDGGETWTRQLTNADPKGFLDCFDFWDRERGIAYGDSIDGKLYVLRTLDGGQTWSRVAPDALPAAGPKEGGFAASGGCVRVGSGGRAWIATGAGGNARVLRSLDFGATWEASEVPVARGESAGLMSVVQTRDALLALGGDLGAADAVSQSRVVGSTDGGQTWALRASPGFAGAIYGAAAGGSKSADVVVAVGPGGVAISRDEGSTWSSLSAGDFWSVAFGGDLRFWVVGPKGAILRFDGAAQ